MIPDVLPDHFCADDVFAEASVGKRQKCPTIPGLIRDGITAGILSRLGLGGDYNSLVGTYSLHITSICLYRYRSGVVIHSVELGLNGIGEWTAVQRLEKLQINTIII